MAAKSLDRTFGALAHPTRRDLIRLLRDGPAPVTTLAANFRMSLPAVSKHIGVLERAGLVRVRSNPADRRVRDCELEIAGLDEVTRWVEHTRRSWERRLDAMERVLARGAAKRSAP